MLYGPFASFTIWVVHIANTEKYLGPLTFFSFEAEYCYGCRIVND